MHVIKHEMWKAKASRIEKYASNSPDTDEAMVLFCHGATEVGFVGIRRNGMARWAFEGHDVLVTRNGLARLEHVGHDIFMTRGEFAELERIVHEAAAWLWSRETA